jgi:lipoprotein-anchoring transpeptidase ErfK/SrfK
VNGARYALLVLACALAGALAAVVLAQPTPAATATTDTTEPPPTEPEPPGDAVIPPGVIVGGITVGGLTVDAAFSIVRTAYDAPLTITVDGRVLAPPPTALGATAYVQNAVRRALASAPDTQVPLTVTVRGTRVRAYVDKLARRFDRAPVDSRVLLRKLRPRVTRERPGRAVDRVAATAAIVRALRTNDRLPMALPMRTLRPEVTRKNVGPVLVIRREAKWLYLYKGARYLKRFRVATGMERYPTPLGRFSVITKARNPWWIPPDSDWAKDEKPIPPGPGNPLGTRWMGISSPGVGIHGTPDSASLGYSLSHGCIRMAIPDAEWLFKRVRVGTTVFIVRA